jgi:uncharacterized alkaline shock family protein YloU
VSDDRVIEGGGGTIRIPESTLAQVVLHAAETVEGARPRRPRRGLDIGLDGSRARIKLELVAQRHRVLPEVAEGVQAAVGEALRGMCDLDVESVDVSIEELE